MMKKRYHNFLYLLPASISAGFIFGYLQWALPLLIMKTGGASLIGKTFSISFLLNAILSLSAGIIADITGRKSLLVMSAIVLVAGNLLILTMTPLLPLGVILIFMFPYLQRPALNSLLAESVKDKSMGKAFSVMQLVGLLGFTGGSAVLGYLSEHAGMTTVHLVTTILSGIVLIFRTLLRETKASAIDDPLKFKEHVHDIVKNLRLIFSNTSFLPFTLAIAIESLVDWIGQFLPGYLSEIVHIDESMMGVAYSASTFFQMMGQPVAGVFSDKKGAKAAILLNVTGSSISLVMFVYFSKSYPIASLVFPMVIGPFLAAFYNVGYSLYIAKSTTEKNRATVYGGMEALTSLLKAPAPILGAVLWNMNPKLVFLVDAFVGFGLTPLLLKMRSGSYTEKRE